MRRMRSTMVKGPEPGTKRSIVEPVELRHYSGTPPTTTLGSGCIMAGSLQTTKWYEGQVPAARSKEGELARRRLAGKLTAHDLGASLNTRAWQGSDQKTKLGKEF